MSKYAELLNKLRPEGFACEAKHSYEAALLIEELAAQLDAVEAELKIEVNHGWDLTERIEELKAKLEAVEQLPALWKRRMARPWQPCAQPDRFISDLTEALQEQKDENV